MTDPVENGDLKPAPTAAAAASAAAAVIDASSSSSSTISAWLPAWLNSAIAYKQSLPSPGPFEALHREYKGMLAANAVIDGAQFTFSKNVSQSFQFGHTLALGGSMPGAPAPGTLSSYAFNAVYADQRIFLNGNVDHEGALMGRINYNLSKSLVGKIQTQVTSGGAPPMVQLEADYTGTGYTLNAKSVNASPVDLTGIYVASALQSLTPRLAIGVECVVQHPQPGTVDAHAMLVAKYAVQGSSSGDYVWTVSASPMGTLATSYFQRISERIELGAELECAQRPDKPTVDAQCTLAGRMTFLKAQFRAQVDSNGRVAAVLEEKLHEGLTLVMSGDVDHGKGGAARFGLGLQVESDPSMQLY